MNTNKQITDVADFFEGLSEEIEEAKEAAQRAKWAEQQANERAVRVARINAVLARLGQHIPAEHVWKHNVETGEFFIDGVRVSGHIWLDETYAHMSMWRSTPTGRFRVVVEIPDLKFSRQTNRSYPGWTKQSYPQKKDGSYNYKAIAGHLVAGAKRETAANLTEATRKANEAAAVRVRQLTGCTEYYGPMKVSASADGLFPVLVKIEITQAMTEVEAQAVHAALVDLGVIEKKK